MAILVRSISQLEKNSVKPNISSCFEISEYNPATNVFHSKKIEYQQLSSYFNDDISASMSKQYNLSATAGTGSSQITINNVTSKVNSLYTGNVIISGQKTFATTIKTGDSYTSYDNVDIPNISKVKSLITTNGTYIGSSQTFPEPFQNADGFAKSYADGETDYIRLKFTDDSPQITTTYTSKKSGYLVMWGWLADSGNVKAELSWVRLEIQKSGKWYPIQVQPWIQGTNSKVLQYIGFNVPIQIGLPLRVRTGFDVNLTTRAFSTVGSMTYNTSTEAQCGFFGYIIQN